MKLKTLNSTARRMIIMLAIVGIVFAALFGFVNFRTNIIKSVLASLADPVQTVATTTASSSDWQPKLSAIGTFRAVNGSDLALQLSGIVSKISFQSGDEVAAGQLLLELRKEDDLAKLASLQATADGFTIIRKRDEGQLKINAVSQATVDSDIVNERNALAQVSQQQAVVDQKMLKAPFAGRLGIRSVDVGQYLSAGTTIVTLQALDRLFLDFTVPQQAVDQIKVGQAIEALVDAFPGQTFRGEIQALNSKVDQASRNVQVRAVFANADRKLLPGMFASVNISVGKTSNYVTLPQSAIVFNPYGNSVFLAIQDPAAQGQPQLIAKQVFVKTGESRGDQVAVTSGVEQGAAVVTAGQIKLRNGTKLKIDNSIKVPNDANPAPEDQ
jgi:membrane fusion protein (multidrug efflux system)